MTLRLSCNSIRAVQACIEPLRRIRCSKLTNNGVNQLIIKYISIFLAGEIVVTLAPGLPAVSHTVGYLFDTGFRRGWTIWLRYSCFTEIFLCKDICSYLAPACRDFHILHFEHRITRRVPDNRCTFFIVEQIINVYSCFCEVALETKTLSGSFCGCVWRCFTHNDIFDVVCERVDVVCEWLTPEKKV